MSDKKKKPQFEDIGKIIVYFLTKNGTFYASLLQQMRRVEDPKLEGRMEVALNKGRIELRYNPEKLNELSNIREKAAICEHECEHVVKRHMSRQGDRDQELWNIACDLAINQTISNLPATALTLDKLPTELNLKKDQSAEYYFKKLKDANNQQKQQQQGGGQGQGEGEGEQNGGGGTPPPVDPKRNEDGSGKIEVQSNGKDKKEFDINNTDSHKSWGKNPVDQDIADEIVKTAVKQAIEQTEKMRGEVPAHLKQDIETLFKPPVIPWQQIARKWIGTRIKGKMRYSWKRFSRRFDELKKGKVSDKLVSILMVMDTSASMSDSELQDAFNEIRGILSCYRTKIYLMQVDAQVQDVQEIKPFQKIEFTAKGRGGTDFNPAFEYVKEEKLPVDLIIYFSDMEIFGDYPPKPRQKVLWVTTTDKEDAPYGQILSIPKNKDKKTVYNRY